MIHLLLLLTAFASASLLVLAAARFLQHLLRRHPQARLAFEENRGRRTWLFRLWDLALHIVREEFPDTALSRLRRRIELDLQRTGAPRGSWAALPRPAGTERCGQGEWERGEGGEGLPALCAPSPQDAGAPPRNLDSGVETFLARALLEGIGLTVVLTVLLFTTTGNPLLPFALGIGLLHTFGIRPQLLHSQAVERMQHISRRLPYAIDLAALVLGAGGTPREGLEMIAHQENNPLGEEFARALAEMHSGAPQHRALSAMAERLQLEDLETLVVAINRGEATGAPMAKALETQAEVFRFRRLQRAERLAVEAPVKMMFPNMLIMLSVLLLVLGPVLVKLVQDGLI